MSILLLTIVGIIALDILMRKALPRPDYHKAWIAIFTASGVYSAFVGAWFTVIIAIVMIAVEKYTWVRESRA